MPVHDNTSSGSNLPTPISADDEIVRASNELAELVAEAEDLANNISTEQGVALVAVDGRAPAMVKRQMAEIRSAVMTKQVAITQKQKELQSLLERKMHEIQAIVGPMQKIVRKMEEGIWSVNLYLGRDEQIVQLMDGEPAPADTPISVRQMVLSMDEECAVAAEEGGLDARDINQFDAWLTEDPAHLEQVFPEQKGIVAFIPRWRMDRAYRDPWEQAQMDEANHHTYFLIRNGERLFRIDTDFDAGKRLVPTADEFAKLFIGRRFQGFNQDDEHYEMKPGSSEYERAEELKDKRQRHYMRVALILQGLVDRSPIFHPLPAERVDFLGVDSYDAGRIVVITNDERAIGDGHEPFRKWQRRLNKELRVGMRIIIASGGWSYQHADWRSYHQVHPKNASTPEANTIHTIDELTSSGAFRIRYERTDYVLVKPSRSNGWQHDYRQAMTKASCVFYPDDEFLLPYDLVTVEEMERYLKTRTDRHNYTSMFPALKTAIAMKKEEAALENPFRQMLTGVLARDNGVSISDAEEVIPDLVDWYKLANRHHRPLVGEENDKAVRMIVAEHRSRIAVEGRTSNETLVSTLRNQHPDALLIARKRDGTYVLLEAENEQNVFVCETTYSSKGLRKRQDHWKFIGGRSARWERLYESQRFEGWDIHASKSEHLSAPDIEKAAAVLQNESAGRKSYGRVFAIQYVEKSRRSSDANKFVLWYHEDLSEVTVDIEHPLTKETEDVSLVHSDWRWKRKPDGDLSFQGGYTWGTNWQDDELPWESGDGSRTVYRDEAAIRTLLDAHAQVRIVHNEASRLRELVVEIIEHLKKEWNSREEASAYARFIEDYVDPNLWDAHRKTLRIQWPHDPYYRSSPIWKIVSHLVEDGQTIAGLSVAAAADLVETAHGITFEVPDDIRDLTL